MYENISVHLMPRKKDDPEKLLHVLKHLHGVHEVTLKLEEHQVLLKVTHDLTVQDIINEINVKTGFKAF